ncbi:hypothetical protein [Lysinibacillus sp. SGAir0095]|uniref:hypothetical protein n=1 Tax=Lysinibacillus sp. SGAir0095 TaxID=2070463 RepID=UPI0010CCEF85|nr:hypothetical protein [Lysinibacillus sp. SGAir0095]QCR33129.1 hypothetical protein C1N55_13475 [Lysinibacillus sp. SGAir0095]
MPWTPTAEEVEQFKTLNQDKSANEDYYKVMLPILLETVNDEYNQCFEPSNLPGAVKLFLAKATQFYSMNSGLKSRSMGSVSYDFDFANLPSSITSLLTRYRKVKVHVL